MSALNFTALDGDAVTLEAGDIDATASIPSGFLPSGVAAGTWLYADGVAYAVQGAKAAIDAQIAAASIVVFGSESQSAETAASQGTTSASQQLLNTLTTPALVGGTYRIGWCAELGAIEKTARVWASLYVDDVVTNSIIVPTTDIDVASAFFQAFSGHRDVVLAAGVHTVKLYLARNGGAGTETVYMQRRRLFLYRIA